MCGSECGRTIEFKQILLSGVKLFFPVEEALQSMRSPVLNQQAHRLNLLEFNIPHRVAAPFQELIEIIE